MFCHRLAKKFLKKTTDFTLLASLFTLFIGQLAVAEGVREAQIRCESQDYRTVYCEAPFVIDEARVLRRFSRERCVENQSFGFEGSSLWVSQGCRADFLVRSYDDDFVPPHHPYPPRDPGYPPFPHPPSRPIGQYCGRTETFLPVGPRSRAQVSLFCAPGCQPVRHGDLSNQLRCGWFFHPHSATVVCDNYHPYFADQARVWLDCARY